MFYFVIILENNKIEAFKIKRPKQTEGQLHSELFGILGSYDALFEADYYPDINVLPNYKESKEVMIELKTGFARSPDQHQLMCYLMVYFGYKALKNFGVLLYTRGEKKEEYLVVIVRPTPKYFQNIILHRNQYILDQKIYKKVTFY